MQNIPCYQVKNNAVFRQNGIIIDTSMIRYTEISPANGTPSGNQPYTVEVCKLAVLWPDGTIDWCSPGEIKVYPSYLAKQEKY